MKLMGSIVLVLFVVRLCRPEVAPTTASKLTAQASEPADTVAALPADEALVEAAEPADDMEESIVDESSDSLQVIADSLVERQIRSVVPLPAAPLVPPSFRKKDGTPLRHRIYSVHSYHDCFPDVQDVHYPVAVANGVKPVRDRDEAEVRKADLLYVGSSPYYEMDPRMSSSIPYLVPKASILLQDIGRRFMDSLAVKGIPLHTIIVTSVLRTEADVAHLRRINGNASEQSCHRYATTFDISYNRYHTVSPPGEPQRRAVRNDSLKFVLSEVLRDMREANRCYIKYEVKQGCFHITVR